MPDSTRMVPKDGTECGCSPEFRQSKTNGTCGTCGGWLPGEKPLSLHERWTTDTLEPASPNAPEQEEEERCRELELRLADAYDMIRTVGERDEDGDIDPDWQEQFDEVAHGLDSALDFALTGGQGCLDDEEIAQRREAALAKHRAGLNLPAPIRERKDR